jgi:hypothetical protein
MTYLLRILFHSQKFIQTSFMKFHVWNVSSCIYKGKKTPKYFGNCINRNSASVHPRPHIKRPSKPISNKKNEKTTTTYQLGFSKFQPFSWHPGCNVEGEPAISYMLAKSFAQKVYSIFREMKINCLILAWINISCFKNTWNFVLLRKNIWFFLIFSMLLVFM